MRRHLILTNLEVQGLLKKKLESNDSFRELYARDRQDLGNLNQPTDKEITKTAKPGG